MKRQVTPHPVTRILFWGILLLLACCLLVTASPARAGESEASFVWDPELAGTWGAWVKIIGVEGYEDTSEGYEEITIKPDGRFLSYDSKTDTFREGDPVIAIEGMLYEGTTPEDAEEEIEPLAWYEVKENELILNYTYAQTRTLQRKSGRLARSEAAPIAPDRAIPAGTYFGRVGEDAWDLTLLPDGTFTLLALARDTRSDKGTWVLMEDRLVLRGGQGTLTARTGAFDEAAGYEAIAVRETPGGEPWRLDRRAGPLRRVSPEWKDLSSVLLPVRLFTFGRCEQDNDLSNGPEPIQWRVLAVEGRRALVIASLCLDARPYNTEPEAVTWETCTLRAWLNSDFLTAAFTPEEQKAILTASVKNEGNLFWEVDGGRDTRDKVFLLSISEAEKFFSDSEDRMAQNTAYALARGAFEKEGHGNWWLRSCGYESSYAADVHAYGNIDDLGCSVDLDIRSVRPALYLDLDSGIILFDAEQPNSGS